MVCVLWSIRLHGHPLVVVGSLVELAIGGVVYELDVRIIRKNKQMDKNGVLVSCLTAIA